jgi:GNAT superfamily N-acetyltransferase
MTLKLTGVANMRRLSNLHRDTLQSITDMVHRNGDVELMPENISDEKWTHFVCEASCENTLKKITIGYACGVFNVAKDTGHSVLHIRTFVVRKVCRGCGIGKDMIRLIKDNYDEISLSVKPNSDASQFWDKMGFQCSPPAKLEFISHLTGVKFLTWYNEEKLSEKDTEIYRYQNQKK